MQEGLAGNSSIGGKYLDQQLGGLCLLFRTHCHGPIERAALPREIQRPRGWWAGRIFERPHPNISHSIQISRWNKSNCSHKALWTQTEGEE